MSEQPNSDSAVHSAVHTQTQTESEAFKTHEEGSVCVRFVLLPQSHPPDGFSEMDASLSTRLSLTDVTLGNQHPHQTDSRKYSKKVHWNKNAFQ